MIKIAIIGGNSQVAAEVSLYLFHNKDIELVCFTRSEYSSVLFKLTSIKHDTIDFDDAAGVVRKLNQFDVVVDFSYPSVQTGNILQHIQKNIYAIIRGMRPGSAFIYMSSIMAFGMPENSYRIKDYRFPRSTYSFIKRKTERFVKSTCAKHEIKAFNLRLGQVHGVLQGISQNITESLAGDEIFVNGSREDLTNTVFASSVGDAIVKCGMGSIPENTYALVSTEQWSLGELYQYYMEKCDLHPEIIYGADVNTGQKVHLSLGAYVKSKMAKYRGVLESYILFNLQFLAPYIKGYWRKKSVAIDLQQSQVNDDKKISFHLLGETPGKIVPDINSQPAEILASENKIRTLLHSAVELKLS